MKHGGMNALTCERNATNIEGLVSPPSALLHSEDVGRAGF